MSEAITYDEAVQKWSELKEMEKKYPTNWKIYDGKSLYEDGILTPLKVPLDESLVTKEELLEYFNKDRSFSFFSKNNGFLKVKITPRKLVGKAIYVQSEDIKKIISEYPKDTLTLTEAVFLTKIALLHTLEKKYGSVLKIFRTLPVFGVETVEKTKPESVEFKAEGTKEAQEKAQEYQGYDDLNDLDFQEVHSRESKQTDGQEQKDNPKDTLDEVLEELEELETMLGEDEDDGLTP